MSEAGRLAVDGLVQATFASQFLVAIQQGAQPLIPDRLTLGFCSKRTGRSFRVRGHGHVIDHDRNNCTKRASATPPRRTTLLIKE